MADLLATAAQAAAVGLGGPPEESPVDAAFRWPDWATLGELEAVVADHVRLGRSEAGPVGVPDEWWRRARLRHALELGERRASEAGVAWVLLRGCLSDEPDWEVRDAMELCRCGEDAVLAAAVEFGVVDELVVREVRRRAALVHGRVVRRARVRLRWRRRAVERAQVVAAVQVPGGRNLPSRGLMPLEGPGSPFRGELAGFVGGSVDDGDLGVPSSTVSPRRSRRVFGPADAAVSRQVVFPRFGQRGGS